MSGPSPREIRRLCRARRRALGPRIQKQHAELALKRLLNSGLILKAERIALYLAADGELDPERIADRLASGPQQLFLPVLHPAPGSGMWFLPWRPGEPLLKNRFGIPEPPIRNHRPTPPWALDLILLPLVAFDDRGNRLGMGGGFYDRTLACTRNPGHLPRPLLFGLAHECQRVERLATNPWDIPLDGVLTESHCYRFLRQHR